MKTFLSTLVILVSLAMRSTGGTTATATATVIDGLVTSITVTDGGSGYTTVPWVRLVGGGGTGAEAVAVLTGDKVGVITLRNSGSGYTGAVMVTIEPPEADLQLEVELVPKITIHGVTGTTNNVEWSTELGVDAQWRLLTTVVIGTNGVVVDLEAGGTTRFYRAVKPHQPLLPSGYVWIQAGTFKMGSPTNENNRSKNEVQHTVNLTEGYWMSDRETTQSEYEALMGNNPSILKFASLPVENVSWEEAVEYCRRLTEREAAAGRIGAGWTYRLPTEAEWEYAYRAGTTGAYPGDVGAMVWYNQNAGNGTHEVKLKQANAWGMYDMGGNVSEWCSDWYGDYPSDEESDPTGPASGSDRVHRGGSWYDFDWHCRAAYRGWGGTLGIGIRPVITLPCGAWVLAFGPAGHVWIPPGTFRMGSPPDEVFHQPNERQHWVTLTPGFWMSNHEVTQREFSGVMGSNPSSVLGPAVPVHWVTWNEAVEYCRRLTEREKLACRLPAGWVYRLPTESEWEYAYRAGTVSAYPDDIPSTSWIDTNSDFRPHDVMTKAASRWGLFDMGGNVKEWCFDFYGDYPIGPVTNPTGSTFFPEFRVVRGGSWYTAEVYSRAAWRGIWARPESRVEVHGFRVVLGRRLSRISFAPSSGVPEGYVRIPQGAFMMGSPVVEPDRVADELQHLVIHTGEFLMSIHETTQEQYESVMGDNPSFNRGATFPVENVSWTQAVDYCARLTIREIAAGRLPFGSSYRLPTEAEWEYAHRAGTTTAYIGGDMDLFAWFGGNAGFATQKVMTKQVSPWGLYDIAGNVWEWCSDWYGPYSGGVERDPVGPATGEFRVMRGGGLGSVVNQRAAVRYWFPPHFEDNTVGFRTVLQTP